MRINTIYLLLTLLLVSCGYSGLRDELSKYKVEGSDVYIMEPNQFQWFLRDYTVWNSVSYAGGTLTELYKSRLFSIAQVSSQKDVIKEFKIKDLGSKEEFFFTLTHGNQSYNIEYEYLLTDKKGNIIADFTKKLGDPLFAYSILYKDMTLTMQSALDLPGSMYAVELTQEDGSILSFIRKEMGYFSDRLEIDINRNVEGYSDLLYVTAALICDDRIKEDYGRYRR